MKYGLDTVIEVLEMRADDLEKQGAAKMDCEIMREAARHLRFLKAEYVRLTIKNGDRDRKLVETAIKEVMKGNLDGKQMYEAVPEVLEEYARKVRNE